MRARVAKHHPRTTFHTASEGEFSEVAPPHVTVASCSKVERLTLRCSAGEEGATAHAHTRKDHGRRRPVVDGTGYAARLAGGHRQVPPARGARARGRADQGDQGPGR